MALWSFGGEERRGELSAPYYPTARDRVVAAIASERIRQEQLREAGRFTHTAHTDGISDTTRLAILMEEVGELAGEVLGSEGVAFDRGAGDNLRKELLHVATVSVAWLERLIDDA